ncbi:MAG TPA: phage holin family protein [Candidatus Gracilibacteria bacterium]
MIKRLILHLVFLGLVFFLLDEYLLVEKFTVVGGWKGYALITILFSLIMAIVKPIAKAVTAPINFLTFGLFSFVINAAMLWLLEKSLEILDIGVAIEFADWTLYPIVGFFMAIVMILIP